MSLSTTFFTELRLLIEEAPVILASFEDADYFRKLYTRPPQPLSKPAPLLKVAPSPPLLEPIQVAKPVVASPLPEPLATSLPPPSAPPPKRETSFPFPSMRSLFARIAPDIFLFDTPPDDTLAKKRSERWKTKNQIARLSILSFGESPSQRQFLGEIAKTLDVRFGPAHLIEAEVIEKEKQWETFLSETTLKWIIVCDYTLWQLKDLMRFYRENGTDGVKTLKDTPLFLLPDLSLYLKDPLLKRSLWKALCQKLAT